MNQTTAAHQEGGFVRAFLPVIYVGVPTIVGFLTWKGFFPIMGEWAWTVALGSVLVQGGSALMLHSYMERIRSRTYRRRSIFAAALVNILLLAVDTVAMVSYICGDVATEKQSIVFFRNAEQTLLEAQKYPAWTQQVADMLAQDARRLEELSNMARKGDLTVGAQGFGTVASKAKTAAMTLSEMDTGTKEALARQTSAMKRLLSAHETAKEAAREKNYEAVRRSWVDFRLALGDLADQSVSDTIISRVKDDGLLKGSVSTVIWSSDPTIKAAQQVAVGQMDNIIRQIGGGIYEKTSAAPKGINAGEFDQGDVLMRCLRYGGNYVYLAFAISFMMVMGPYFLQYLRMWLQEAVDPDYFLP